MTKRRTGADILSGVTPREQTVLLALGMRLTNREIAELLHISPRTVESHVASLLRKLSVSSRQDLIQLTSSLRYSAGELQAVMPPADQRTAAGRPEGQAAPPAELRAAGTPADRQSDQVVRRDRTGELFQLAFDHAPIGMQLVSVAPDGRWTIVRANAAMAALFGEEPASLVGRVLDGFPPATDHATAPSGSDDGFGAEKQIHFHRSDGTSFVAEARAAVVGDPAADDALALIRVIEVASEPSA